MVLSPLTASTTLAAAGKGGHGTELLHCPRCYEVLPKQVRCHCLLIQVPTGTCIGAQTSRPWTPLLPTYVPAPLPLHDTQREGRHRCKGPPVPGPAAAAAAAAAAAEASKIAEAEAAAEVGADRAKRGAAAGKKRVRWALPDSDEEEEHTDGSMSNDEDEEDGPTTRRAAVAAAVAAAAAQESPLRIAPAAPALSTPRGAAAAQLLAGLRGGQLILPPGQPLGAGKPALQGATWWQSAVRPELAAVPAALPAGGAAAAPAAAKHSVAEPPVLSRQAPAVLPLAPLLLPLAGAVPAPMAAPLQVPQALPPPLPEVPPPQALSPPLEHALGQLAGLAVAASVGELLLLLKVGAGCAVQLVVEMLVHSHHKHCALHTRASQQYGIWFQGRPCSPLLSADCGAGARCRGLRRARV